MNWKEILLKSAGWADDIFLRDTPESKEIQARYVKDMNMIRFENFWDNRSSIYFLCDKYGLMAIVGLSCHWEWEAYYGKPCSQEYGCILSKKDMELVTRSFEYQVLSLPNYTGIIA